MNCHNEARFLEAHALLKTAWAEPHFDFEGKFYQTRDCRLEPAPLQKPHPPLWVANFGNPASTSFAARQGYPILVASPNSSLSSIRQSYQESGSNTQADVPIALLRLIHLHHDSKSALDEILQPARWYMEHNPSRKEVISNLDQATSELLEKFGVIGSPADCVAHLREIETKHQIHYLIAAFGIGGLAHESSLRSMRLFAEQVMPEFQGRKP